MTKDQTQLDKFKAAARELDCDDDPARFDAMVEKIAKGRKKDDETRREEPEANE